MILRRTLKINTKLVFSMFNAIGSLGIFALAQLSIWYGGLATLLPGSIVNKWNYVQMVGCLLMMGLFYIYRKTPNIITVILILMQLLQAFSTYNNNGMIEFVNLSRFMGIILLFDFFSKDFDLLINPFMVIFEFMTYYNLFTVIHKGPDMYGSFYGALGYDNGFISYLLTAYFWALLYMFYKKKIVRPCLLIIVINYTLIYTWSATGLFGIFVLDLLVVINFFVKLRLSLFKGFLIFLVSNFAIVFLRIQNIFSFIIVDILHKDISFTGRTTVWDSSIKKIPYKFLLGYGFMGQEKESQILGDVYCHNALLEILFRGGLIRLILFGLFIYIISKKTEAYLQQRLIQNLIFCISILWIISITESVLINNIIFVMFCTLYILPKEEKQQILSLRFAIPHKTG